jgi:hypothetical protein
MNPSQVHFFNVDHASRYGMVEAILITNFQYWITRNKANGDHCRDGRTWTYNSVAAFAQQFPYLSADQVRRALERLIAGGVLVTGNYNARGRDRTRWYAFADEKAFIHIPDPISEPDDSHLATVPNGKVAQKSRRAASGKAQSHLANLPNGEGSHLANLPNAFGTGAKWLIRTDVNTYKRGERASASPGSPWWASDTSVLAEGKRLGLTPGPSESMPLFKARVQAAHSGLAHRPAPQPSAEVIAERRADLAQALAKAPGRKP